MLVNKIDDNPCVYYFVNFLVDSILGAIFCLVVLKLLQRFHVWEKCGCCLWNSDSGFYGDPPQVKIWLGQLGVWLTIVTVVKFILLALIVAVKHHLYRFGAWVMSPINNYPRVELLVVMVVIPFLINVIVFWISDNVLMHSNKHAHAAGAATDGATGGGDAVDKTTSADNDSGVDKTTEDEEDDDDGEEGDEGEEGEEGVEKFAQPRGAFDDEEHEEDTKLLTGPSSSLSSSQLLYKQAKRKGSDDAAVEEETEEVPHEDATAANQPKRYSKTRIMFRQPTSARDGTASVTNNTTPDAGKDDKEEEDEETRPDDPRLQQN